jgi:hypothetical protein
MTTPESIQLIFSGIVTLSTVVYSILTWQLVSETRRMREFQITPDICVFFEMSETDASFVHIIFKNLGQGYAKNVKFMILKNFENYDNKTWDIQFIGIVKEGIESLYSNQYFKFFFTDLSQNNQEKRKDYLELRISCEDINNKKYSKDIRLSLTQFSKAGVINPPDNYIGRISYEMTEIKRILQEIYKSK